MALGDRMKTLRTQQGMSQEQAARAAEISLQQWGRIERGDVEDPQVSTVRKIARGLNTSAAALMAALEQDRHEELAVLVEVVAMLRQEDGGES